MFYLKKKFILKGPSLFKLELTWWNCNDESKIFALNHRFSDVFRGYRNVALD